MKTTKTPVSVVGRPPQSLGGGPTQDPAVQRVPISGTTDAEFYTRKVLANRLRPVGMPEGTFRLDGRGQNHRFHRARSAGSLEHRELISATVATGRWDCCRSGWRATFDVFEGRKIDGRNMQAKLGRESFSVQETTTSAVLLHLCDPSPARLDGERVLSARSSTGFPHPSFSQPAAGGGWLGKRGVWVQSRFR